MGKHDELFDHKNVIGYSEDDGKLTVYVSQKQPEDELDPEDIVPKDLVDDVYDVQYGEEKEGFEAKQHKSRERPCVAGVSEMNERGTAGTAGPLARLDGDLVRLSNNHVYARTNEASIGETIIQPSPMDYGTQDDRVGTLTDFVELHDNAIVDIAARSTDKEESLETHNLPEDWPLGKEYSPQVEQICVKSGRSSGVTEGQIISTNATIRVEYGPVSYILDDQLIGDVPSVGGDSGAPVFTEYGDLVGVLFAGSDEVSVWNKVSNIEGELGVEILTELEKEESGESPEPLKFREVEGIVTEDVRKICDAIQEHDIESTADLARKVDMSSSMVRYRLDKMEDAGIIEYVDGSGNAKIPQFTRVNIQIESFN